MAVLKAYFADGLNISKIPVLVEIAEAVGLDGAEEVLTQGEFKERVDRAWKYSRTCGIAAVPTFVANGLVVVGAQAYSMLEELIKAN